MSLHRIAAVDDAPDGRAVFGEWIGNLFDDAEAVLIDDPPVTAQRLIERVQREHIDGVMVDYKLSTGGYSREDGIDLVTALTRAHIPAVLATSYSGSRINKFVWYGRHVPAVVPKGDLHGTLVQAFDSAMAMAEGRFTPTTEPYPSIVRIASLDESEAGLVISSFGTDALLVPRKELAARLPTLDLAVGLRFEADVNIGAQTLDSLYLNEPRPLPELDERYAQMLRS